ncbi:patatin-like phospholipase family protein [Pseudaquabacterium pictum]|nr:patatin-like phospholipase family protein [Rubrivivax pictus]
MPSRRTPRPVAPKDNPIALALQGGGSHGAFTWGVLDRLLEDETLPIGGISGTSAGALNAAVLACGWVDGGRAGARAALRAFWLDVASQQSPWRGGCFGGPRGLAAYNLDNHPLYAWQQQFLRLFSPYQFNPLGADPLREVLQRHVSRARLEASPIPLFIIATAVRTGQPRVFERADLDIDPLLASACLPQLFRAVQIDGEPYWDGGYSGNPALWPLVYNTPSLDLVLVKINPLVRPGTPDTPAEIADRVNEITFNQSLVGEMRAIDFVNRLLAEGKLSAGSYKGLRLHMVADDAGLAPLQGSSKVNTDRGFLEALHALGRAAAERWLAAHRADVGVRSSLDLRGTFLAPRTAPGRLAPG